jgi:hypothetical protein
MNLTFVEDWWLLILMMMMMMMAAGAHERRLRETGKKTEKRECIMAED